MTITWVIKRLLARGPPCWGEASMVSSDFPNLNGDLSLRVLKLGFDRIDVT